MTNEELLAEYVREANDPDGDIDVENKLHAEILSRMGQPAGLAPPATPQVEAHHVPIMTLKEIADAEAPAPESVGAQPPQVRWIATCTTSHCQWLEMCKLGQTEEDAEHRLVKHVSVGHLEGATGRVFSVIIDQSPVGEQPRCPTVDVPMMIERLHRCVGVAEIEDAISEGERDEMDKFINGLAQFFTRKPEGMVTRRIIKQLIIAAGREHEESHKGDCICVQAEKLLENAPTAGGRMPEPRRMTKKERRQARRREKRAILGQMPYRTAEEWAEGMVTIKETMDGPVHSNEWQIHFAGYDFPAKKDKAQVERHAADLKRVLRRKLRHYGAQEKRALCAIFGQRQKEGRDILRPELRPPVDTEPPKEQP